MVKDPSTPKKTPWHHDQSYYPIDGDQLCSIWIPVDEVDLQSSLKFVKGSHKFGWFMPRKFATAKEYQIEETTGILVVLPNCITLYFNKHYM